MKIKGILDKDYFDYRLRRKKHSKYKMRFYYGGRNLGKTTRVIYTEYQDLIAEYKSHKDPTRIKPIIHLVRTEKLWQKIKSTFLHNLKKEPFNLDFIVEGTKIWFVQELERPRKNGEIEVKRKRLFQLGQVLFLWSADDYKMTSLENYKMLIYDEIIPENEGYIPREIEKFNTMLSTFTRLQDDKYIVAICNTVNDDSPYFTYFGLSPDTLPNFGEAYINPQKSMILECIKSNEFIQTKIKESTAGNIQSGSDYLAFTLGNKVLRSNNWQILNKPSGEYHIKYNVWIEGESYSVYQYSLTAYWIKQDNNPYVKNYYLDMRSALINSRPHEYISPDSLVNDFKVKLSKDRLWFHSSEVREIFLEFFKKYG